MVYEVGICSIDCRGLWVGFWYCKRTSVDHVTLQDSRQPWDNVSNGIKFGLFVTYIELSLDVRDEKLHCRTALMKIQMAGR